MVRMKYVCMLPLLLMTCAGDRIVSAPPQEKVLLWRGDRVYAVAAGAVTRRGSTAIELSGVRTIADVDASKDLIAIAAVPSDLQGCKLLLGTARSGFRDVAAVPSAVPAIALSDDGQRIGFSRFDGNANAYDIYIYDAAASESRLLASKAASPTGSLSFRSGTRQVTFEDLEGRVSTIDLDSHERVPLMSGKRPRWAHDGSKLAYRTDDAVYVYDVETKKSTVAYRRTLTDGNFDGSLFWSGNDQFLAFNLNVGVDASNRRCVMIDTRIGAIAVAATTPYLCGPFLPPREK